MCECRSASRQLCSTQAFRKELIHIDEYALFQSLFGVFSELIRVLLWRKERTEYALFESLFAIMNRALSEYALPTELIHE